MGMARFQGERNKYFKFKIYISIIIGLCGLFIKFRWVVTQRKLLCWCMVKREVVMVDFVM